MFNRNRQKPLRGRQSPAGRILPPGVALLTASLVLAATVRAQAFAGAERRGDVDAARASKTLPVDLHEPWSTLLSLYVRDGVVDYQSLGNRSRDTLDVYVKSLSSVPVGVLAASSRNAQLAFWINAYNAFTVKLIVDHYPVDGIWQVTPFWRRPLGGPFAVEFIPLGASAPNPTANSLSLDDIENEILRGHFKEPLIHFALVCASKSCPRLAPEAYTAGDLDEQLRRAAADFLGDGTKNRYRADTNTLEVSKIFDWFQGDFAAAGGARGYFERFGPRTDADRLRQAASPPKLVFLPYDWSLNGP